MPWDCKAHSLAFLGVGECELSSDSARAFGGCRGAGRASPTASSERLQESCE